MKDSISDVKERSQAYTEQRNNLFAKWKNEHGIIEQVIGKQHAAFEVNHSNGIFVSDGILCPNQWFSQSVRPLFLLKEAYGGDKDWDLVQEYLQSDTPASKMWKRIAEWSCGLMKTTAVRIAPYTTAIDNTRLENEFLNNIAVVNVKKSNGRKDSDMDEIRAYAAFDRSRLKEQLEICDPTIIICGYTRSALDIIMDTPVRTESNENLFYRTTINGHSVIILDYWHPANQYPDIMNYYGLMGIYHAALNSYSVEE